MQAFEDEENFSSSSSSSSAASSSSSSSDWDSDSSGVKQTSEPCSTTIFPPLFAVLPMSWPMSSICEEDEEAILYASRTDAALKVQTAWRRCRCTRRFHATCRAALKLQRWFRKCLAAEFRPEVAHAASIVQSSTLPRFPRMRKTFDARDKELFQELYLLELEDTKEISSLIYSDLLCKIEDSPGPCARSGCCTKSDQTFASELLQEGRCPQPITLSQQTAELEAEHERCLLSSDQSLAVCEEEIFDDIFLMESLQRGTFDYLRSATVKLELGQKATYSMSDLPEEPRPEQLPETYSMSDLPVEPRPEQLPECSSMSATKQPMFQEVWV